MYLVQVHRVDSHPLEAAFQCPRYKSFAETPGPGEEFCSHKNGLLGFLQELTKHPFGATASVDFRCIDKADAHVQGNVKSFSYARIRFPGLIPPNNTVTPLPRTQPHIQRM